MVYYIINWPSNLGQRDEAKPVLGDFRTQAQEDWSSSACIHRTQNRPNHACNCSPSQSTSQQWLTCSVNTGLIGSISLPPATMGKPQNSSTSRHPDRKAIYRQVLTHLKHQQHSAGLWKSLLPWSPTDAAARYWYSLRPPSIPPAAPQLYPPRPPLAHWFGYPSPRAPLHSPGRMLQVERRQRVMGAAEGGHDGHTGRILPSPEIYLSTYLPNLHSR